MNYLDVGASFGMPTAQVFAPWNAKVMVAEYRLQLPALLKHADMVGFGGGADIHPSLYGCRNVGSGVGHSPSDRDQIERLVFTEAVMQGIPIFGICRGAQLLCALSGGKLVQDVTGHGGDHTLTTAGGAAIPITSTHHQMMYPWDVKHELIAWTGNRSKHYTHDIPDYVQHGKDPEVVFFPDTGAFAVQGHPEWMDPYCLTVKMIREWVNNKFQLNQ